jgi:hypothetical protein
MLTKAASPHDANSAEKTARARPRQAQTFLL